MADREARPTSSRLSGVVSEITLKALQQFDTGDMDPEQTGSASPEPTTGRELKPPTPKSGSRPTSAAQKSSRPGSAAIKTPSRSASETDQLSISGERPPSAARSSSRTSTVGGKTSLVAAEKETEDNPLSISGSRPTSAKERPPSAKESRPTSAKSSRPPSSKTSRPTSAKGAKSPSASKSPSAEDQKSPSAKDNAIVVPSSAEERPPSATRPVSAVKSGSRPGSAVKRPTSAINGESARRGTPDVKDNREETEENTEMALMPTDDGGYDEDEYVGETDVSRQPPAGPPGGGDGGGNSDGEGDDSDGDDYNREVTGYSDEDSDNEADLVVLDPDHPLMRRFQNALKKHLEKQNETVTLELRELEESLKTKRRNREDLGVELYGVQQELARYQMILERNHDDFATINQERLKNEQELNEIRNMYKNTQTTVNKEKKKSSELQAEVENLALRLFYMKNAKEDVRSDINVMRRAAEKAESEVSKAEIEKQRQDLYVDRLVERVDKLKEEMAMYEAQITAQSEETKAAKEALTEAYMEIEVIDFEKKQLFQQWNSSLIGMRRRDEAHSAMQEALSQQHQKILSLETEIDGFKKNISKEQEQNEKLCMILAKTERDIETVRKQLNTCQAKHDALKSEYTTYTRMLHETEQALHRAMTDKTLRMNELNALRQQIEKEYLEKVKLEDEIMERMRTQLTMDKASQYSRKLTNKMRDTTKHLETQMAEVENHIAKDALEASNVKARTERLKKVLVRLDDDIAARNDIISRSNNEITKRNALIERKQNLIDQYNKRLEHMISSAGGVELGPLEIQINSLSKSIDAESHSTAELQQQWLRQESELVKLLGEKSQQSQDVIQLKKQITILSQKKIRTEKHIDQHNREQYDIERNIKLMQNDMLKLNTLLFKQKGAADSIEQTNILQESEFLSKLREAENESIKLQDSLDAIKEEKERLLNSLVEAERQIMLWEKKTQLARETRAAVDSEVGQGEVAAMKSEIHRMQVRYSQLMKQQEKMIQEMEKAVSRRDTIVTRGDAQTKMKSKPLTKGTFERQMAETRKKIKTTIQDANACEDEIRQLHQHQQILSHQLEDKQLNCQQLQGSADSMDSDIERLAEMKQRNMTDLLSRQQKTKYYQQAKDGKYTMMCKSETGLNVEYEKQVDRLHTLNAIVDRLNQEYPHAQPALRKVTIALSTRSIPTEEET
ncbi:hypothetical protein SNE40_018834 [Patella caerulea]|uniref:Coiled-coil domain-containing protein 40 n=1 Tax=Patella caerulea TaxID=87958 RepID=A0AAN8PDE7_PATCE